MKMLLILGLISAQWSFAGIYGEDNRHESQSAEVSTELRVLSRSVPAIMEKSKLKPRADGDFDPQGYPMSKMGFCSDVRFSGQQYMARCGSSLIGPDLVLTAGHCIDDNLTKWCNEHSVVLDYAVGLDAEVIPKKNVYDCEKVIYRNFEMPFGEDLALIKLKNKVMNRELIKLSSTLPSISQSLTMIGYPLGIAQKVVDEGEVTMMGPLKVSFRHNLDTFSSNSGGPIFALDGTQVGVLVRGTGPNQQVVPELKCMDWGIDKVSDYAEANTLLHLIPVLKGLGVDPL